LKFNTKTIHAKKHISNANNALNPPIFMTSTYTFENIEKVKNVMNFESDDFVYTRGNNPTINLFEQKMAQLENGSGAVAFASGMAAISSTLFSLLKSGDTIIGHRTLYGSSYNVLTKVLPKYNIANKIIDLTQLDKLEKAIDENVRVIYFETPSNPNLEIIDIAKICTIAKKHSVKVVVDNTFSTPYITNPLDLGVDVVVHSATKYISGHGDTMAGVAISKDKEYINSLKFDYMCEFGGVLSPFNAWLLLRGIKTLGIRMEKHMKNALEIAKYLESHPKVSKVFYPGLKSFEGYQIAKKQMKRGFGAIISFEIKAGEKEAIKFIDNVKLFSIAVSLGDCESLIELPSQMTHNSYNKNQLKKFGLSQSMLRLSIGLEDSSDLIKAIDNALKIV